MSRPTRVLSLYEGFFAGGARILHSDVVAGLHATREQQHGVLAIASAVRRESTRQPMQSDPRYRRLVRAGVAVDTLGRESFGEVPDPSSFTDAELRVAADAVSRADLVLSLKEQPIGLLLALRERGWMPQIPVATCLHRSDPLHSGPALGWLAEAARTGLVTATISCADSTSDAYARAGVHAAERFVIANGIDTKRFQPGTRGQVAATRRRLGIPSTAPVIVFAARFDAMKDPGLFLRAVAEHARRSPETHYVLCGAGMTWQNAALEELVAQSEVATPDRLHALGIRDDMPSIYQIADVVALTSAFGEASPLCLIEGAACGATPVTTDVGDAARQIDGIGVATPHDPRAIADAWTWVLERRADLRATALAARARLGRDRMIGEYAAAMDALHRRSAIAA